MDKYHIALTDDERQLLARIDLRDVHRNHEEGHTAYKANREPILALLKSLSRRNAVPRERLSYWNDPAYNSGRIKASHKGVFERNGCAGTDIYTHPHFLGFLRYFLFGAALPDPAITAFEEKVGNPNGCRRATLCRWANLPANFRAVMGSRRRKRRRSSSSSVSTWGSD